MLLILCFRLVSYFTFIYSAGVAYKFILFTVRSVCELEKKSPFESSALFTIISIATLCIAVVTTLILICTKDYIQILSMKNIHYTILKYVGAFSAILAYFSLILIVYPDHENSRWTDYIVVWVGFGFLSAMYIISDLHLHRQTDDAIPISFSKITYGGLIHVPLSLMLVLFLPENLDWILYSVLLSPVVIEWLFNGRYFFKKGETNKVFNLEPDHQHDKSKIQDSM